MSSTENSASADGSDCLSMVDVLAEQTRLQEDASAVLGDSDEVNCTYEKGYVQRQALYACDTCSTSEPAGICLACSYRCHEGHDLYELYTKRFFRCDCGNSKFQDAKCKLRPSKDPVNIENQYNQNFKGQYCVCSRPYPDPEDEIEDEMIQCVICEDWYHGRHLGTTVPENEDYQEMICAGCMEKHSFLSAYHIQSKAITVKTESGAEQEKVEVGEQKPESGSGAGEKKEPVTGETIQQQPGASDADRTSAASVTEGSDNTGKETEVPKVEESREQHTEASDSKADSSSSDDGQPPAKRPKTEDASTEQSVESAGTENCLLQDLRKREIAAVNGGTFWPSGWRNKLCRCSSCLKLYKDKGVEFLLDENDTVHAYEERGRIKSPAVTDTELTQNALSQMNRIQQVEVLQGFIDLKTELREFLKGFADRGQVVGEEDIRGFFSRMEERKRERLSGLQYHCK